jgi:hypothetical protein
MGREPVGLGSQVGFGGTACGAGGGVVGEDEGAGTADQIR